MYLRLVTLFPVIYFIQEGYWAHHIDDGSVNGMLEYYQCPPGYCQCSRVDNDSSRCNSIYYYDDNDRQCVCDREGTYRYTACDNISKYVCSSENLKNNLACAQLHINLTLMYV